MSTKLVNTYNLKPNKSFRKYFLIYFIKVIEKLNFLLHARSKHTLIDKVNEYVISWNIFLAGNKEFGFLNKATLKFLFNEFKFLIEIHLERIYMQFFSYTLEIE